MMFPILVGIFLTVPLACVGGESAGAPEPEIEGAWVRATTILEGKESPGANSAVYLSVRNRGGEADALLGGETPVAASLELHESRLDGDVMRMRQIDRIELPPGERVLLEPGGYHLMLVGLRRALTEGDTVPLSLDFERSERVELRVPVRRYGGR